MDVLKKDIYFNNYLEKIEGGLSNLGQDDDDVHTDTDSGEDEDEVFELPSKSDLMKAGKEKKMRNSVSAEAYGTFNKK